MASNQDKVFAKYARTDEDIRAEASRSSGLEFHYTKKAMSEFISQYSRVLEVGCGTGYYGMYFADKCKEYVGVDLFPKHIEVFQSKVNEHSLKNVSCSVGDATQLDGIADNSFDVVCCFGPMYHLPPNERELVFAECRRVCKPGGIIAFAFINKVGAYVGACVHDQARANYPTKEVNEIVLRQGNDDSQPGVFFFTMPEEMIEIAARHGLSKIRTMGTDSFITVSVVDQMDDAKFEAYMELADEMAKYESCAGMSNHALLICRKDETAE